jgi:hypothetical protein
LQEFAFFSDPEVNAQSSKDVVVVVLVDVVVTQLAIAPLTTTQDITVAGSPDWMIVVAGGGWSITTICGGTCEVGAEVVCEAEFNPFCALAFANGVGTGAGVVVVVVV